MAEQREKLSAYRRKRDFRKTPEPTGKGAAGSDSLESNLDADLGRDREHPIFVIQQHAASSLHWDFRIEVDGVLKSWAVPKGPSTDPREKRLAVATEDHPLDYADFEGVIPEDEYGAGTVIVWDAGPYRNLCREKNDDEHEVAIEEALERGHAEVWLEGKKLRGGYALVHSRMGGEEKNWLLVKMKDEGADARRKPTRTEPRSVLSDRTLEEVARDEADNDDANKEDDEGSGEGRRRGGSDS
jgi:DNA ligase D-like protein (predicted 3'-phosphoesterase)